MVFTFGTPMSYGIFRDPFSDAFGASPISLSVAFAIMLFAFYIGSGLVGVFGVRAPARALLFVCTLALACLAPSLYLVDSVVALTVVFVVLGLALGTGFVVIASVVPRWFEVRRGTATGLIFAGNGFGLFVVPPTWQYALAEFGVRRGFLVVTTVTAFTFLLATAVCERPAWVERSSASAEELLEWLGRLAGTRTFRLLFVGMALSFAWYQLLAAFAVDLFAYRGLTQTGASVAFGLIGGVSIVSRISGGYLGDLVGTRSAFLASLVCVNFGVVLLFFPGVPTMLVAVFLLGLGLGGSATLYIPLVMNIYASEMDTAIVGVFTGSGGIAALAMPPLGTASVAYTDGFTVAIGLTLATIACGTWAVTAGTSGT
ncbi:MFS transporter [Natrarchaeobius oligotrophus]|uniref:MFS transporter n=2 Tax=Natrarchaeobius TaxID=2501796 RepID=A0A3N6PRG6_NATCH|nr:MFS transporter [Natrarchaeobius chitinivorans]RQH02046.1 MFS transporter [Natrarchaeobius chitinivorans]